MKKHMMICLGEKPIENDVICNVTPPSIKPETATMMSDNLTGSLENIYKCPLPYLGTYGVGSDLCYFSTSEEGFKGGENIRHLSQDHMVEREMMNLGFFKFDKM